jgi:hypothetical protein
MRTVVWVGVLTAVAAAGLVLRADEQKPAPQPKAGGEFNGKVVVVMAKGGIKSATLEGVVLRTLGARAFLVGKSVGDEVINRRDVYTGAEVWVPVDEVESLAVFDNLGQLRRSAAGP